MEKIEKLFFSNLIQMENNIMRLINNKSKENTSTKFNFSRNLFLKNKNKTSSNFNLYKYSNQSNHNSSDTPNKKEELFKSDIDSMSNKKTMLVNSAKFAQNFLKRINNKNIRSQISSAKTCDKKNYSKITHWLNLTQIKKRKIDYIKSKFLSEQKNYYKKLFQKEEFGKINSFLWNDQNKFYNHIDKFKKIYFEQDKSNSLSMKNKAENFSISSYNKFIGSHTKKNNYTSIKIRKYNSPNIIKKSNYLFLDYKNNIKSKKNYSIDISKENKKNNKQKENKGYKGNYELKKNDKIIDDNYNEYLKGISSSESNKSKSEANILSKKNNEISFKKIKPWKSKLLLNDRSENAKTLKRLNQFNYSNIMFRNNKKLLQFRKLNSNKRKISDDISNSIIIENHAVREKIPYMKKVY